MKQFTVTAVLALFVLIGIAAINAPSDKPKNLKVLPKNISEKALDSIMDSYNAALGVNCNFCHKQDKVSNEFDYASDSKSEKLITRKMMLMTTDINKKYFKFNPASKDAIQAVTCKTCHRGNPMPALAE